MVAVSGQRSAVSGQRSAVSGQRSAVSGQRSAVSGQRSAVSGQRSAVSSQRSAVSGQRSAVSGQLIDLLTFVQLDRGLCKADLVLAQILELDRHTLIVRSQLAVIKACPFA
jgi:hypothetical protein